MWTECEQEWCTHCLTPPFLWPGLVNETAIDRHPGASVADPYYERSQCFDKNFDFFTARNTIFILANSTIDNIRVRANSFLNMQCYTMSCFLSISNTTITRMDFSSNFISGYTTSVQLSRITVSGWNRDHAFNANYQSDQGFLYQSSVENFLLEDSVFEDNIMLSLYFTFPMISVASFRKATLRNCVFRRSLTRLSFYGLNFSIFEVINCIFQDEFQYAASYMYVDISNEGSVLITDSQFTNIVERTIQPLLYITVSNGPIIITQTQFTGNRLSPPTKDATSLLLSLTGTNVTIANCTFTKNRLALSTESNLITELIDTRLLKANDQFILNYLSLQSGRFESLIYSDGWEKLHLINVTVRDNNNCYYGIFAGMSSPFATNMTILGESVTMKDVDGGLKVENRGKSKLKTKLRESEFTGIRQLAMNLSNVGSDEIELELVNCRIGESGGGILFRGTLLDIRNSSVFSITSHRGAIDFQIINSVHPAVLLISSSSFLRNQGGVLASDVNIVSLSLAAEVIVNIGETTFEMYAAGSLLLENLNLREAAIHSCKFSGGISGVRRSVMESTHLAGVLQLEDVIFDHNIASTVLFLSTPGEGSATREKYTRLNRVTISDSRFTVALKLQGHFWKTKVLTSACRFLRNQGIVIWNSLGVLFDSGSTFEENAGCYYQEPLGEARFQGTRFSGCTMPEPNASCLYLQGPSSYATFEDCVFEGNSGTAINIEKSAIVEISKCSFSNNSAQNGAVVSVTNVRALLSISDSQFKNNRGKWLFEIISSVNLVLAVVTVEGGSSGIRLEASAFTAVNCSFSNHTSEQYSDLPCLLSASLASTVNISESRFFNCHCYRSLISTDSGSSLIIASAYFQDLSSNTSCISTSYRGKMVASAINVTSVRTKIAFLESSETSVQVSQSLFSNLTGTVFISKNNVQLILSNVLVSQISNATRISEAEALYCIATDTVELRNVQVRQIRAAKTGLSVAGKQVELQDCEFEQVLGGEQGAVFVHADNLILLNSVFAHNKALSPNSTGGALTISAAWGLIQNCRFISNSASAGGAIYWTTTPPVFQNTSFELNQARHGPTLASPLHHIKPLAASTWVLASGQTFTGPLVVSLLDFRNQLVKEYPEGNEGWLTGEVSGELQASLRKGLLRFSGFRATATPGSPETLEILLNSAMKTNLNVQFRSCIRGEIMFQRTCVLCHVQTYSVKLNSTNCTQCPAGGSCPGDGHLYSAAGHWRPSHSYPGLLVCPNTNACIGHLNYSSQTGLCAAFYEGNLCQSCAKGASRSSPDKCAECPSALNNRIRIALAALVLVFIVGILTRSALRAAQNRAKPTGTLVKIFFNYVQVAGLIARFQIKWPGEIQDFFAFYEYSGNSGEQEMSIDCLITEPYFGKTMAVAVLPLVLVLINVIFWVVVWGVLLVFKRRTQVFEKCVCSTIVSLFYFQPHIMRIALSSFSCLEIEAGELWVRLELSVRCWDSRHTAVAFAVALPSVLLWGLGIPTATLLLLVRYRRRLRHEGVRTMVGFLCGGYRGGYFYWEVIIIYRKTLIAMICALMITLPGATQMMTLVLLLCAATILQYRLSPFRREELNRAELLNLGVVLWTAYAGLFFNFGKVGTEAAVLLFVLTLLIHCGFLFYFLRVFFKAVLRRLILRMLLRIFGFQPISFAPQNHHLLEKTKAAYIARLQAQLEDS